jgi:hypothetical protein
VAIATALVVLGVMVLLLIQWFIWVLLVWLSSNLGLLAVGAVPFAVAYVLTASERHRRLHRVVPGLALGLLVSVLALMAAGLLLTALSGSGGVPHRGTGWPSPEMMLAWGFTWITGLVGYQRCHGRLPAAGPPVGPG